MARNVSAAIAGLQTTMVKLHETIGGINYPGVNIRKLKTSCNLKNKNIVITHFYVDFTESDGIILDKATL